MHRAEREEAKESSVEPVPAEQGSSDTTGMLLRLTVLARETMLTEKVALS